MAKRGGQQDKIPALEWIVGGLGLVIALFILGALGWQAVAERGDSVAQLAVRIDSVTSVGPDQVATVTVTNASGRTAASVQVEGVAGKGTPDEQVSSATIDYVPGHGEASAALIFAAGTARKPITARVTGYEHP